MKGLPAARAGSMGEGACWEWGNMGKGGAGKSAITVLGKGKSGGFSKKWGLPGESVAWGAGCHGGAGPAERSIRGWTHLPWTVWPAVPGNAVRIGPI